MFSELNDYLEENKFNQKNVKQSVISHLRNLSQWLDKYFPEDTIILAFSCKRISTVISGCS